MKQALKGKAVWLTYVWIALSYSHRKQDVYSRTDNNLPSMSQ